MPLGSIVIVGHGLKSQWVKSLLITFSAAQSDDTWNIGISECKAQSKTRLLGQRSSKMDRRGEHSCTAAPHTIEENRGKIKSNSFALFRLFRDALSLSLLDTPMDVVVRI